MADSTAGRHSRSEWLGPYIAIALVIGASAWPLMWKRGRDSFPLSPYPMFSTQRASADVELHYVVALAPDRREPVPPALVANSEPMLAKATVRRAVRAGRGSTTALCESVARRVARSGEYLWAQSVAVMTGVFDARRYLRGDTEPLRERTRASCRVTRGPP